MDVHSEVSRPPMMSQINAVQRCSLPRNLHPGLPGLFGHEKKLNEVKKFVVLPGEPEDDQRYSTHWHGSRTTECCVAHMLLSIVYLFICARLFACLLMFLSNYLLRMFLADLCLWKQQSVFGCNPHCY